MMAAKPNEPVLVTGPGLEGKNFSDVGPAISCAITHACRRGDDDRTYYVRVEDVVRHRVVRNGAARTVTVERVAVAP